MSDPIYVFSCEWFAKHQPRLLRWLNARGRLRRKIARWICAVTEPGRVTRICPSTYTVEVDSQRRKLVCYSGPVIARRLRRYLSPVWYALHAWDAAIARPLAPAWDAGFLTLTKTPQPGSGGANTTVDGRVQREPATPETFAVIRSGAGTHALPASTVNGVRLGSGTASGTYTFLNRSAMTFDTSSLGASANIESATLRLRAISKVTGLGNTTVDIVDVTLNNANALVTADYDLSRWGTTVYAQRDMTTLSANADEDFVLSSFSAINKTGITQLGARPGWDTSGSFTGTWAASTSSEWNFRSADDAGGASTAPRLIIVYGDSITLDGGGSTQTSASVTIEPATSLNAASALASGDRADLVGSHALGAAATTTPGALLNMFPSGSLSASAMMSFSIADIFAALQLATAGSITAAASATMSPSLVLVSSASDATSALGSLAGIAALSAAATEAAGSTAALVGAAALAAGSGMTAGTIVHWLAQQILSAAATWTASTLDALPVCDARVVALTPPRFASALTPARDVAALTPPRLVRHCA